MVTGLSHGSGGKTSLAVAELGSRAGAMLNQHHPAQAPRQQWR